MSIIKADNSAARNIRQFRGKYRNAFQIRLIGIHFLYKYLRMLRNFKAQDFPTVPLKLSVVHGFAAFGHKLRHPL